MVMKKIGAVVDSMHPQSGESFPGLTLLLYPASPGGPICMPHHDKSSPMKTILEKVMRKHDLQSNPLNESA